MEVRLDPRNFMEAIQTHSRAAQAMFDDFVDLL